MSDARVEKVNADWVRVRFVADADIIAVPSGTVLHDAAMCACDVILQAIGLRVPRAMRRAVAARPARSHGG